MREATTLCTILLPHSLMFAVPWSYSLPPSPLESRVNPGIGIKIMAFLDFQSQLQGSIGEPHSGVKTGPRFASIWILHLVAKFYQLFHNPMDCRMPGSINGVKCYWWQCKMGQPYWNKVSVLHNDRCNHTAQWFHSLLYAPQNKNIYTHKFWVYMSLAMILSSSKMETT